MPISSTLSKEKRCVIAINTAMFLLQVAEQGTHAELMRKRGEYYKLVESQTL